MTTPQETSDAARANVLGSIWIVMAMAGFAVEDMLLKVATQSIPIGQVMVIFGLGGGIAFAAIASFRGERLLPRRALGRVLLIRTAFEIMGRLFYTLAIALTPLSSVTAILQATPIVVVAGAALFFGEKVGWRRWSAISVGLVGVMLILRPGADVFEPLSILAVLGTLGFAGRDLATRAVPPVLGTAVLGVYGFIAIIIAGLAYSIWDGRGWTMPPLPVALVLLTALAVGVFAYASLTRAMRTGDVSVVTPFRYSRLIFGIALGMLIFGERPDVTTYIGSAIVVLSGLYILARGQKVG